MIIENFSMKDYDEIIQIWEASGINLGSSDTKEEIEIVFHRNPELFLVGKIDGEIISVVIGAFDGRRGYVYHLAVSPKYQKNGYGTQIVNELNERFKKKGVHKVHLFIEKNNDKIINFYKKLGWEIRDDLIMMSFVPDEKLYKRNL
ncbi:MAG: GNAT family N-acetyltransferase [Promethearchaeota archaeon]